MSHEVLKLIWLRTFGATPHPDVIEQFVRYLNEDTNSYEAERVVLWLLMKSSPINFRVQLHKGATPREIETARALWVVNQLGAYQNGKDRSEHHRSVRTT
jgi:hypothetical protein